MKGSIVYTPIRLIYRRCVLY